VVVGGGGFVGWWGGGLWWWVGGGGCVGFGGGWGGGGGGCFFWWVGVFVAGCGGVLVCVWGGSSYFGSLSTVSVSSQKMAVLGATGSNAESFIERTVQLESVNPS